MLTLPALALAGLGGLAGTSGCGRPQGTDAETGFAEGDGNYTRISPDKRVAAPTLEGKDLDGKPLSLADGKGKVIVVNVWGSWCAPCRHEAPALVEAAKKAGDKAVFLGLNTRDLDPARAKAFVRTFGITWRNFYDPDGALLLAFGALPAKAIPSTLVIDPQGRIAARVLGEVTASTLLGTIDDIAAGK